jgi:hypothetical protein
MFTLQQVTALTAQTAVASAVTAYDVDGGLLPVDACSSPSDNGGGDAGLRCKTGADGVMVVWSAGRVRTGGAVGTLVSSGGSAAGKGRPALCSLIVVRRKGLRSGCRWATAGAIGDRLPADAGVAGGRAGEPLSLAWAFALRKADCKRDQVRSSMPSLGVAAGST